MSKFNIIDLFAGCGGLSDGFEKTGHYSSLAFVEWEKSACKTLFHRFRDKWKYENLDERIFRYDIQKIQNLLNGWHRDNEYGSSKGLLRSINNRNIDAIIGGPPCQAYSIAGRVRDEHGMQFDYRNYLFESYLALVEKFRPKLFLFENVPGILSAKPGGMLITERITDAFHKIDYEIIDNLKKFAVLNSFDFGVPQNRKRVIIVGVDRNQIISKPLESLKNFYMNIVPSFYTNEKSNVKNAIGDLQKIFPLESGDIEFRISHTLKKENVLENHKPRFHNKRDQEIFYELAVDALNGKKKYPNTNSILKLYADKIGKNSNFFKYNVLEWDKPSNTIPAHLYKDGLRHIHPDPNQKRSITVREAARLQSFDDDFVFYGSVGDQYKMVGNAVPPLMAKGLGFAIAEFLKENFKNAI